MLWWSDYLTNQLHNSFLFSQKDSNKVSAFNWLKKGEKTLQLHTETKVAM